jgi:hypothetical protein
MDDSSNVSARDLPDDDGIDDKWDGRSAASDSSSPPSGTAEATHLVEQSAFDSLLRSDGGRPIGIIAQKETEIEICLWYLKIPTTDKSWKCRQQ